MTTHGKAGQDQPGLDANTASSTEAMRWQDFWDAIDLLAAERGLSASGLARAAGLDATALNPSRRQTSDGRLRWPRMETVLLLLDAAGLTLSDFSHMLDRMASSRGLSAPGWPRSTAMATAAPSAPHVMRMIPFSLLALPGLFDRASLPSGRVHSGDGRRDEGRKGGSSRWREVVSPIARSGPHDYAVQLDTPAYEPIFRAGALIVLAPDAAIRVHDRVLHRFTGLRGEAGCVELAAVKEWDRRTVSLRAVAGDAGMDMTFDSDDRRHSVHRVVMASL